MWKTYVSWPIKNSSANIQSTHQEIIIKEKKDSKKKVQNTMRKIFGTGGYILKRESNDFT